jgi:hypothetical protein
MYFLCRAFARARQLTRARAQPQRLQQQQQPQQQRGSSSMVYIWVEHGTGLAWNYDGGYRYNVKGFLNVPVWDTYGGWERIMHGPCYQWHFVYDPYKGLLKDTEVPTPPPPPLLGTPSTPPMQLTPSSPSPPSSPLGDDTVMVDVADAVSIDDLVVIGTGTVVADVGGAH